MNEPGAASSLREVLINRHFDEEAQRVLSMASANTISEGFAQALALYGAEKPRAPIPKDHVPWIAFLNNRITTSTRHGVYTVYLFKEDLTGFYLALEQGVTSKEKQFYSVSTTSRLAFRVRQGSVEICGGLQQRGFAVGQSIDLAATDDLGLAYRAGAFAGELYERAALPDGVALLADLEAVLSKYDDYVNAGEPQPTEAGVLHLVLKWSAAAEPETITLHKTIADERGSV